MYTPITYIVFNKLNVLVRKFNTTSMVPVEPSINSDNLDSDNLDNDNLDIVYDMNDIHIKKLLFGEKTLIFYSPDIPCDPAPDDSDMSNKDINPDTWMDIPPYD